MNSPQSAASHPLAEGFSTYTTSSESDSQSCSVFPESLAGDEQFMEAESTLSTTVSEARTGEKEDDFDTKTIFTDNESLSLPEDTKGQLIAAFASETLQEVGKSCNGRIQRLGFQRHFLIFSKSFRRSCLYDLFGVFKGMRQFLYATIERE